MTGNVFTMNADQLMADAALRRMNHVEWLSQLALALDTAPRLRRETPNAFRVGVVERVRLAVKYIDLLQREARDAQRELSVANHELAEAEQLVMTLREEIEILKGEEGR